MDLNCPESYFHAMLDDNARREEIRYYDQYMCPDRVNIHFQDCLNSNLFPMHMVC